MAILNEGEGGSEAKWNWNIVHTFKLLLGNLGTSTGAVQIITYATGGGKTDVERSAGTSLSHCYMYRVD